jgi:hypothetical protein
MFFTNLRRKAVAVNKNRLTKRFIFSPWNHGNTIGGTISAQTRKKEDAMESGSKEELRVLLAHAGYDVPDDELDGMLRVYQVNQERLKVLHAANLDDEEVAGAFSPKTTGA